MSDDDLRALEREMAAGGPGARLRLARALQRAGRCDDAHDVLLPAREDPEARRELREWPAWKNDRCGPRESTGFFDVAPLSTSPTIAWERPSVLGVVSAGPLALVVLGCYVFHGPVVVHDPVTGEERWRIADHPSASVLLSKDVLLVQPTQGRSLRAHDLATGEILYDVALPGFGARSLVEQGFVATTEPLGEDSGRTRLHAFVHDEPREPPRLAWTEELSHDPRHSNFVHARGLLGDLVVVGTGDVGHAAFDRETGAVVWRVPGRRVVTDVWGLVTFGDRVARDREVSTWSARGERLWDLPEGLEFMAVSPTLVVASSNEPSELVLLDRASGERRGSIPLAPGQHAGTITVARNVILHDTDRGLRAFDDRGSELWSRPTGQERGPLSLLLAAGHRRLYELRRLEDRYDLLCLEDSTL